MPKQPTYGGLAGGGAYKPPQPEKNDDAINEFADASARQGGESPQVSAETSPLSDKISASDGMAGTGPTSDDLNWVRERLRNQGNDDISDELASEQVSPARASDFLQDGREYHVSATVDGDAPAGEDYSNLENEPGMRSTDVTPVVDDVKHPQGDRPHTQPRPTTRGNGSEASAPRRGDDGGTTPGSPTREHAEHGEDEEAQPKQDGSHAPEDPEGAQHEPYDSEEESLGQTLHDDGNGASPDYEDAEPEENEPSNLERMSASAASSAAPVHDDAAYDDMDVPAQESAMEPDADATPGKTGLAEQKADLGEPNVHTNKDTAPGIAQEGKGLAPRKQGENLGGTHKPAPFPKQDGEDENLAVPPTANKVSGTDGGKPDDGTGDGTGKTGSLKDLADKASTTLGKKEGDPPSAPVGKKGLANDAKQTANNIKAASDLVGKAAKVAKHIPVAAPVAAAAEKAAKAVGDNADKIAKGAQGAKGAGDALKGASSDKPGALNDKNKQDDAKEKLKKARMRRIRRMILIKIMPILLIVMLLLLGIAGCSALIGGFGGSSSGNETLESDSGVFIPTVNMSQPNANNENENSDGKSPFDGEWRFYDQCAPNWDTSGDGGATWGSGCGAVSFAMIMTSYSKNAEYTPSYFTKKGINGSFGTCKGAAIQPGAYSQFCDEHVDEIHLKLEEVAGHSGGAISDFWDEICKVCKEGGCVEIDVGELAMGTDHYVVIRSVDGGKVQIANPNGGKEEIIDESDFKGYHFGTGNNTNLMYFRKV